MNLIDFMQYQQTSPEAMAMLQQLWSQLTTQPFFLAANSYRIGQDYKIGLRTRLNELTPGDNVQMHATVHGNPAMEFEVVLFGEIVPPAAQVMMGSTIPLADRLPEHCFMYKNGLYDLYGLRMPQNASMAMASAYMHQLSELRQIVDMVATFLGVPTSQFCSGVPRGPPGYPDFEFVSPPTYKLVGDPPQLNNLFFLTGHPITYDDHPLYPRDEIYDLHQRRHRNWAGFRVLNRKAIAVMKGTFKFIVNRDQQRPLKWLFLADNIKVIAQDEE